MKYTKNIGIKLKLLGFDFHDEPKEKEINYDVWVKDNLGVAVDHTNKIIEVEVIMNDKPLNIKSLEQLKQLDKLINQ